MVWGLFFINRSGLVGVNKQSMAQSLNDAGYYFTQVTTTQETEREQAPMLLVYSELQSLVQASGF